MRIGPIAPIGSLLKKSAGHKHGRVMDDHYLSMIRKLPCMKCGAEPAGQAAHLRAISREHGKDETGMGRKPDDKWTLPLCGACHVSGPGAQHSMSELTFWRNLGIDPFRACERLYAAKDKVGDFHLTATLIRRGMV